MWDAHGPSHIRANGLRTVQVAQQVERSAPRDWKVFLLDGGGLPDASPASSNDVCRCSASDALTESYSNGKLPWVSMG